jgi:hypothetical protein
VSDAAQAKEIKANSRKWRVDIVGDKIEIGADFSSIGCPP